MYVSADNSAEQKSGSFRFMPPVLRLALLAGVVVHLAGFLLFRLESTMLPIRDQSAPFVRYLSASSIAGDLALEEQSQLFDSAPLFIPTEWNAAQIVPLAGTDRTLDRFQEFEPQINLSAALKTSSLPVQEQELVQEPVDLLRSHFWAFFDSFGQVQQQITPFPESGHIAVVSIVGKEAESWTLESSLNFSDTVTVPEPVQLYLRVSGSGLLIGEAVVAQSSGNPSFDLAAKDWISSPQVFGQFPVGYLSITIYP